MYTPVAYRRGGKEKFSLKERKLGERKGFKELLVEKELQETTLMITWFKTYCERSIMSCL